MRFTLTTLLLIITATLGGLKAQSGYQIRIDVEGYSGNELYLAYHFGDKQFVSDTTYGSNGSFIFSGDEQLPEGMYMVVFPPEFNFFEILISEDDQQFSIRTDIEDLTGELEVTGSSVNQAFYEYQSFLRSMRAKVEELEESAEGGESSGQEEVSPEREELNQQVRSYQQELINRHRGNFLSTFIKGYIGPPSPPEAPAGLSEEEQSDYRFYKYRAGFFENTDLSEPGLLRTPIYQQAVDTYLDQLTVVQADSMIKASDHLIELASGNKETFKYMVVLLLNRFAQSSIMGEDAVYVHLALSYYQNDPRVDWVEEEQRQKILVNAKRLEPLLIGKIAPDIRLNLPNSSQTSLHRLNSSKKVLLITNPEQLDRTNARGDLEKLTEQFSSDELIVIELCVESQNGKSCKDYYEGSKPDWMYATSATESQTTKNYAFTSGYKLFVLDDENRILYKRLTPDQVLRLMTDQE